MNNKIQTRKKRKRKKKTKIKMLQTLNKVTIILILKIIVNKLIKILQPKNHHNTQTANKTLWLKF